MKYLSFLTCNDVNSLVGWSTVEDLGSPLPHGRDVLVDLGEEIRQVGSGYRLTRPYERIR